MKLFLARFILISAALAFSGLIIFGIFMIYGVWAPLSTLAATLVFGWAVNVVDDHRGNDRWKER